MFPHLGCPPARFCSHLARILQPPCGPPPQEMKGGHTHHREGLACLMEERLRHQRDVDALRDGDCPSVEIRDDHVQLGKATEASRTQQPPRGPTQSLPASGPRASSRKGAGRRSPKRDPSGVPRGPDWLSYDEAQSAGLALLPASVASKVNYSHRNLVTADNCFFPESVLLSLLSWRPPLRFVRPNSVRKCCLCSAMNFVPTHSLPLSPPLKLVSLDG